MSVKHVSLAGAGLLAASLLSAASTRSLSHRVWLLDGVPDEPTVSALRAAGVDGFVLPVGKVDVGEGSARFTLAPVPDLKPLAGTPVTGLVWVEGAGKATGDPAVFAAQFAPVARSLPRGGGLMLAARRFFPGLPEFARGAALRLETPVELALAAADIRQHLPPQGWPGLRLVALVFGNPAALAFATSTLQDDAALLDQLDASRDQYRAAVVVRPRAAPPPGAAGASLAELAGGEASTYHPGEHGDVFVLRRALDWGGVPLEAGQSITVEVVDTARYHRDLGLLLRPVHDNLLGWDTVGLPAPEPTLGMSREAFVEYLRGGSPSPVPEPEVAWGSPSLARVAVANRTAQGSAIATTANWVELQFTGTEVLDVQLGEFSGAEYLRAEGGAMRRTVARDATAVRLFLTYVPPRARVGGGAVRFLAPPRSLATRWGVRLGDGSELSGPLRPAPPARPAR